MSSQAKVAAIAGVSKATVSRVISQRGNVHPETVRIVRAAMSEAKYEPPLPRDPRSFWNETNNNDPDTALTAYALIVPEIATGLYVSLLNGFSAAADERYRQAIVCNTADNLHKQGDEILQLIQKRVSGVAMVPVAAAPTPRLHVEALQRAGIPVVLLHRGVENTTAPLIALPLDEVAYRAGRAILAQGHRRLATFNGVASGPSADMHNRGIANALRERGLELNPTLAHICPSVAASSLEEADRAISAAVDQWLSMEPNARPTAAYTTNDAYAELLYMQLISRGLSVPADFSIISFGGQRRLGAVAARLTTIVVDELAVGRLAVEMLEQSAFAAERGIPFGRMHEKVELSLYEGKTLAPPRSNAN